MPKIPKIHKQTKVSRYCVLFFATFLPCLALAQTRDAAPALQATKGMLALLRAYEQSPTIEIALKLLRFFSRDYTKKMESSCASFHVAEEGIGEDRRCYGPLMLQNLDVLIPFFRRSCFDGTFLVASIDCPSSVTNKCTLSVTSKDESHPCTERIPIIFEDNVWKILN